MVGTWGLALQEEHKVVLGNRDPHVLVPFPWHYEIRQQVKGRAGSLGRPDTFFNSLRKTKIWKRVMMLTWEGGSVCIQTLWVFSRSQAQHANAFSLSLAVKMHLLQVGREL